MSIRLIFWKLEIKRALRRVPQMFAGVVVLLFLAGTTAFFASRSLYGQKAAGRIPVGVVLPGEEFLAQKALSMIASLDSVKSMCDFIWLDKDEALEGLRSGELYAVMEVPEGLVQGIMDGTNVPVRVWFPDGAGLESRIFQELTDAGAGILSSAQAGIYAGDQLCRIYGLEDRIPLLEQDLNRIFLSYSLPRQDYFRHIQVSATGDLDTAAFYGISAYVLILLLCAVPVSGYLLPGRRVLDQKLWMAGIGPLTQTLARTAGLGLLLVLATLEILLALNLLTAADGLGLIPSFFSGTMFPDGVLLPPETGGGNGMAVFALRGITVTAVCVAAAALTVLVYRLAGSLMGGILVLFLMATAQHFLAGGFLPLVFLPASVQALAPWLPSAVLMEAMVMALTAHWDMLVLGKLILMTGGAVALAALGQARGRGPG